MSGDEEPWLDVTGWHEAPPPQQPVPALPFREVLALCCPECSSLDVRLHDNGRASEMVRWACLACGGSFKIAESESRKCIRCYGFTR